MDIKKRFIFGLGIIFLFLFSISNVSAANFYNISMTTSISNTTLVFDALAQCDAANINPNNITLLNCSINTNFYSELFFNETNAINYTSLLAQWRVDSPSNIAVFDKGLNHLYINWTTGNVSNFLKTMIFLENINIANTTGNQYNLTGLNNSTKYNFTFRNIDGFGHSNESNFSTSTYYYTYGYSYSLLDDAHACINGGTFPSTGCTIGNGPYAYDGNFSTTATYISGTSSFISAIYENFTKPYNSFNASMQVVVQCNTGSSSFSGAVPSTGFNQNPIQFKGYVVDTGTRYNYVSYWNGTAYEDLTGSYLCSGSSAGYTEMALNFTLYHGLNIATPLAPQLLGSNVNISGDAYPLSNSINITLYVYNSSGSLVASRNGTTTRNYSALISSLPIGTYSVNGTANNGTHITFSNSANFTIYNLVATLISPLDNQKVNNTLNISWMINSTGGVNITSSNITIDGSKVIDISGNASNYTWNNIYNWNLSIGNHDLSINLTDTNGIMFTLSATINITRNTYINITTKDAITNASISNFTIIAYSINSSSNETWNTTSGQILMDAIRGYQYNITLIPENYAHANALIYASQNASSNYTFYVYETNSILITIRNESNSAIISGTTIYITLTSDDNQLNYSTTSGTIFIGSIPEGYYDVNFQASGYTERDYFITMTNGSTQTLTAWLLDNSTSAIIGTYTTNNGNEPIYEALITIQRQINGSYITIAQELTDGIGYARFELEEGEEYMWLISASGYNLKQFLMRPYAANEPYSFKLQIEGGRLFTPFNDYIVYATSPSRGSNVLASEPQLFSFTTASTNSSIGSNSILWTSLDCNGTLTNITGSPSGTTIYQLHDLGGYQGVYSCIYGFQVDGYQPYYFTIQYYINGNVDYNASLTTAGEQIVDNTPEAWKGIIGMFLIMVIALIIYEFTKESRDQNLIMSVACFSGLLVLGFLGFFDWIMCVVLSIEAGLMYYTNRGGY